MLLRIYTDTSVIGGCQDEEFRVPSQRLLDAFVNGEYIMVLSELTLQELDQAPSAVRNVLTRIPEAFLEVLSVSLDANELASAYIAEGLLAETKRADAVHIAVATLSKVDVLVSWNFKHIVNLDRIHGYNSVNLRRGFQLLEIRSPWEVLRSEPE